MVSWPYSGPPETAWETGVNSGVQFYTEPCKTTPAPCWTRARLVIVVWGTHRGRRKNTELNRVDSDDVRPPHMYIVVTRCTHPQSPAPSSVSTCVHLGSSMHKYGNLTLPESAQLSSVFFLWPLWVIPSTITSRACVQRAAGVVLHGSV